MAHLFAKQEHQEVSGGYAVRRPRRTDPIGESLRKAFAGDTRGSADFDRLLRRLDRIA